MKSPWPAGIALVFVLFAAGLAVFVRAAIHKPEQLVRADYYDHELAYQQHIDQEVEARGVNAGDVARFVPGTGLVITLPAGATNGVIQLYRPSDAKLDRTEAYAPGADGRHVIAPAQLAPGVWRARLVWRQNGRSCYKENGFEASP